MIKLDKNYSLSYKNGYFQTHLHGVRGSESKNAGEACIVEVKTYPTLLRVWEVLKEKGVDGNAVMHAGEKLLIENQKTVSKAFIKAKAKKEANDEKY